MGQKINPVSFRLPITRVWQSKWFANKKDYSKNVLEDLKIRKLLSDKFSKTAGINYIEIKRFRDQLEVVIYSSRPGILIGRSGQGILEIRKSIAQNIKTLTGKSERIKLEIIEVKNPDLVSAIVAQNIALQLEKRINIKRAVKQTIEKVMQARAKGVKIQVSGRLGGAEIARQETYGKGSIPLGRLRAEIDFAKVDAFTTYGTIGIKVWIYKGDKFIEEENVNTEEIKT